MADEGSEALERQIRIAARPETVFGFLTDPVKILQWIGTDATIEPTPGGVFRIDTNGRDVVSGHFVEVTPYSRVVFTWGWEGGNTVPPGSTTVEISLTPDGDGTIVRLRHLGLPKDSTDAHVLGWDHYLPRLGAVASGEDPGPDPMASLDVKHG